MFFIISTLSNSFLHVYYYSTQLLSQKLCSIKGDSLWNERPVLKLFNTQHLVSLIELRVAVSDYFVRSRIFHDRTSGKSSKYVQESNPVSLFNFAVPVESVQMSTTPTNQFCIATEQGAPLRTTCPLKPDSCTWSVEQVRCPHEDFSFNLARIFLWARGAIPGLLLRLSLNSKLARRRPW